MEKLEQQLVVLAALLHDIGMFAQRAGAPHSVNPSQNNCSGEDHSYALFTDYFITNHLPLPPELEDCRIKLARMASTRRQDDALSREELCIQEGDCLSSGNDKIESFSNEAKPLARLEGVFSQVHLRSHNLMDTPQCYQLKPLDAEETTLFPVDEKEAQKTTYQGLYADFLSELKEWPHGTPCSMGVEHYLHSLQTILERFTWCIPLSTRNTSADVSLFDHSYTTAAIAQALYYGTQTKDTLKQTPLLLFGGELSGIQNFIFGEGEQGDHGASKLLRARSFSLQMLTRSIWMVLLERCGLSSAARIMDAGGRFILLLPDTPDVRKAAAEVTEQAMQYVLEYFNGVLRITFTTQELKAEDLRTEKFRSLFQQMNDKLEHEKLRPFASVLEKGFSPLIGIKSSDYAKYGLCPFCGIRPALGDDKEHAGCRICSTLIQQIGSRLPEAQYAVFSRFGKGFSLFDGLRLRLEKEIPTDADAVEILSLKERRFFSAAPVAGYVPRMTEADIQRWKMEKRPIPKGGETQEANAPKTFGILAGEARIPEKDGKKFRSVPFLAACKADVDNLGLIFGIGLESGGKSRFSISHFAMLSRMMHHFFSSYLINVIEKEFPNIYVVFAGGDDLFVLGPWSDTVRFAERLHDAFSRFTGNNPDVTISAGVALAKPGLPMRAIKNLAENQLEAAKGRTDKDGTPAKNAISLFGVTCSWAKLVKQLEQGEWLEELCLSGDITQGFVRRLLGYSRQAAKLSAGDISAGLYRSHMVYDMARNCSKNMDKKDADRLRSLCHDDDFKQMEISITWALYRTRTTV